MPPGKRRRKRSIIGSAAILALAAIKVKIANEQLFVLVDTCYPLQAHLNAEALKKTAKRPIKIDLRKNFSASRINR